MVDPIALLTLSTFCSTYCEYQFFNYSGLQLYIILHYITIWHLGHFWNLIGKTCDVSTFQALAAVLTVPRDFAQATPLPRRPSRGRPSCRSRGGWRPRRGAARMRLRERDPRLVNGGILSFGNIPWLFQILKMVILGVAALFLGNIQIEYNKYITTSLGNSDW
jgi:hypothetical protein